MPVRHDIHVESSVTCVRCLFCQRGPGAEGEEARGFVVLNLHLIGAGDGGLGRNGAVPVAQHVACVPCLRQAPTSQSFGGLAAAESLRATTFHPDDGLRG